MYIVAFVGRVWLPRKGLFITAIFPGAYSGLLSLIVDEGPELKTFYQSSPIVYRDTMLTVY